MLPKLLQLCINVFLLQSIIFDSGEHLTVYLAAFRILVRDLNIILNCVYESFESSVRRHFYSHIRILSENSGRATIICDAFRLEIVYS